GLNTERNIGLYIMSGYLLGEDFDKDFKAVQQFLPDKNLSENVRGIALENWTKLNFETLQTKK
ncbi:MAG: hypothetical protein LH629_12550, partial [Ignavibacteria bacterium]|nr:hypothetical protein [Ignavibacteria bacterium]